MAASKDPYIYDKIYAETFATIANRPAADSTTLRFDSSREMTHFYNNLNYYRAAVKAQVDKVLKMKRTVDNREYLSFVQSDLELRLNACTLVKLSPNKADKTLTLYNKNQVSPVAASIYSQLKDLDIEIQEVSTERPSIGTIGHQFTSESEAATTYISPTDIAAQGFNLSPQSIHEKAPSQEPLYQNPADVLKQMRDVQEPSFDLLPSGAEETRAEVEPSEEERSQKRRANRVKAYNDIKRSYLYNQKKKVEVLIKPSTQKMMEKICDEYNDLERFWLSDEEEKGQGFGVRLFRYR